MLVFISRKTLREFVNHELNIKISESASIEIDTLIPRILSEASKIATHRGRKTIKPDDIIDGMKGLSKGDL